MAKTQEGWNPGKDAAYIKPKLIPDYQLTPRDDSGGYDYDGYTATFGDGGYVIGDKAHLSAKGGKDDDIMNSEVSPRPREDAALRKSGDKEKSPPVPSKLTAMAKK